METWKEERFCDQPVKENQTRTKKFLQVSKLMMTPHMRQRGMKSFICHITRALGREWQAVKQVWKWLEKDMEWLLACLLSWVRLWPCWGFLCIWDGVCIVWTFHWRHSGDPGCIMGPAKMWDRRQRGSDGTWNLLTTKWREIPSLTAHSNVWLN